MTLTQFNIQCPVYKCQGFLRSTVSGTKEFLRNFQGSVIPGVLQEQCKPCAIYSKELHMCNVGTDRDNMTI